MSLASTLLLLLLPSLAMLGAYGSGLSLTEYEITPADLSQVAGQSHFVADDQRNLLSCAASCSRNERCAAFGFREYSLEKCLLITCEGAVKPPSSYMGYTYYITLDERIASCMFCATSVVGGLGTYSKSWMVVQRRLDGSVNFYRNWLDYKNGFGDQDAEFWIGNDQLHELTKNGDYKLRVEMVDNDGVLAAAEYDTFIVGDEASNYAMTVTEFNGCTPPGNSMGPHNGLPFSTTDRDNSGPGTCASACKGGWWYAACHDANLNGAYGSTSFGVGINWKTWKGFEYSLSVVRMMVKRK